MNAKEITEIAFRLLNNYAEVSKEKTLDSDSVERISQRVKGIRAGLAIEMEFVAAVNWLAHVVVVHRLEQIPMPNYHDPAPIKIPDVLAIVTHHGRLVPALIEVKATDEGRLVWGEKYMGSLQRYAEAVQMPLLVAWKRGHLWALTDVRHFHKRVTAYHLDFKTAMKESLMGVMFGDLFVVLSQRVKFFLDAAIDGELPPLPAILPEGNYKFNFTKAGFTVDDKITELSTELFWAFISGPCDEETVRTTQNEIRIQFTPEAESMFSLTDLWRAIALWGDDDEEPDWDGILRRKLDITAPNMREHLRKGTRLGVIQLVLSQKPHTMPDFLTAVEAKHAAQS
jgi:Holliday junction resolvase